MGGRARRVIMEVLSPPMSLVKTESRQEPASEVTDDKRPAPRCKRGYSRVEQVSGLYASYQFYLISIAPSVTSKFLRPLETFRHTKSKNRVFGEAPLLGRVANHDHHGSGNTSTFWEYLNNQCSNQELGDSLRCNIQYLHNQKSSPGVTYKTGMSDNSRSRTAVRTSLRWYKKSCIVATSGPNATKLESRRFGSHL